MLHSVQNVIVQHMAESSHTNNSVSEAIRGTCRDIGQGSQRA